MTSLKITMVICWCLIGREISRKTTQLVHMRYQYPKVLNIPTPTIVAFGEKTKNYIYVKLMNKKLLILVLIGITLCSCMGYTRKIIVTK